MKGHEFNFAGGEYLTKIGATWFVSYSYYLYLDRTHLNWNNIKTADHRKNIFEQSKQYHEFWLSKVENMSNGYLEKNLIGVDASSAKRMARELLKME